MGVGGGSWSIALGCALWLGGVGRVVGCEWVGFGEGRGGLANVELAGDDIGD